MKIDIFDNPLTTAQAGRMLPGHPDPSTVWRWMKKGRGGIRLDYVRVGRKIVTDRPALERFVQRLTEADAAPDAPTAPAADPGAEHAAADAALQAMGI